ncbi:Uncharacterised protein [Vibrio cholerae]|nr:Uncharacterised protein [Vibrio cholerae]
MYWAATRMLQLFKLSSTQLNQLTKLICLVLMDN